LKRILKKDGIKFNSMANFKVIKKAELNSENKWIGELEFEGEILKYSYKEDINGQEVLILVSGEWVYTHPLKDVIYAACQEWGNPEEFGDSGTENEIDDETVDFYK